MTVSTSERRRPRAQARLAASLLFALLAGCQLPARLNFGSPPAGVVAGTAHLQAHDVQGAMAEFNRAIQKNPRDVNVYVQVVAALEQAHQQEQAAAILDQAAAVTSFSREQRARLLAEAVAQWLDSNNGNKAVADGEAAYALDPDDPNVLNGLGYAYAVLYDADQPGDAQKLARAELLTTRAVMRARDERFPDPNAIATYLDSVGWVEYRLHHYADAVANLERAADQIPDNATVQYHLGMAYEKLKRYQDASIAFKRALQIQPTDKDSIDALTDLGRYLLKPPAAKQAPKTHPGPTNTPPTQARAAAGGSA